MMILLKIIFGFLAGLMVSLGLGGGFFLIIYLTVVIGMNQIKAQALNLFFFIVVATISVILSAINRLINFKVVAIFVILGLVGVCVGLLLEFMLPVRSITKLFAIFLFVVGLRELYIF